MSHTLDGDKLIADLEERANCPFYNLTEQLILKNAIGRILDGRFDIAATQGDKWERLRIWLENAGLTSRISVLEKMSELESLQAPDVVTEEKWYKTREGLGALALAHISASCPIGSDAQKTASKALKEMAKIPKDNKPPADPLCAFDLGNSEHGMPKNECGGMEKDHVLGSIDDHPFEPPTKETEK